jgi:hypothetical protein
MFLFRNQQRELLSTSGEWQVMVGDDGSIFREVIAPSTASDTNSDGVNDTVTSEFLLSGGVDLECTLTQRVEPAGGSVALFTQEYTIRNNSGFPLSIDLVRVFDGNLVWSDAFENDEVGTAVNGSTFEPFVFMREEDDPATTITLSSPQATRYFGGKHGVDPDGGGGSAAYGLGTDTEIWDALGVPTGWRDHVAGVGYDTNGVSGASPPGSTDPEDAFVGLEIPVSLSGGGTTTITIRHTYGDDEPGEVDLCPADVDDDGAVGVLDLIEVIFGWGGSGESDVNGDETTDVLDLVEVIESWGPCLP